MPPDDGCTDGEGCGQGYKVRDSLRRGGLSYKGSPFANQQIFDTFQLNPVAKAVFSLASVTFEVYAHH